MVMFVHLLVEMKYEMELGKIAVSVGDRFSGAFRRPQASWSVIVPSAGVPVKSLHCRPVNPNQP